MQWQRHAVASGARFRSLACKLAKAGRGEDSMLHTLAYWHCACLRCAHCAPAVDCPWSQGVTEAGYVVGCVRGVRAE